MVNLIQAKEQFAAYCKGYDTQDERVALKIVHSQKVAEISKQLAIHRNCSAMDVDLAEVTGLYHDIGRFVKSSACFQSDGYVRVCLQGDQTVTVRIEKREAH